MDPVFRAFLGAQVEAGLDLARQSDVLELVPLGHQPIQRFLARFSCRGLVGGNGMPVGDAGDFGVGITFPDHYLRRALVPEVVTLIHPVNLFHPNARFPFICVGHLAPGLPLVALLYQIFEIITYHKYNLLDGLNPEACAYARANRGRFPLDRRPLRRPLPCRGSSSAAAAPL
jgi:hypothetical protein